MSVALPTKLPLGWTANHEKCPVGHTVVVIQSVGPRSGFVTVDPAARAFRGGMTCNGPKDSTELYQGRGWLDRLYADAIEWLAVRS